MTLFPHRHNRRHRSPVILCSLFASEFELGIETCRLEWPAWHLSGFAVLARNTGDGHGGGSVSTLTVRAS